MNLEESVRRVIVREGLLQAGDRVLVGVSGGIDSSTLLFVLNSLKERLEIALAVAHVNHQLRGGESERDEAFVRDLAARLEVPFHLERVDVPSYGRAHGKSFQHAGRDLRYRFFRDVSVEHRYNKIAIGHNRDDQVETFLLRIIKGTGIHGLSSIPIKRERIVRPFLCTYRWEIEEYASSSLIPYVEDSSNRKDGYERNFLRHHIVPLMEQLNPRFRDKVLSLLTDVTSLNARIDKEADHFLNRHVRMDGDDSETGVEALRILSEEVRFRVVTRLLSRLAPSFIPLREHIRLVDKSLLSCRPNNSVHLPCEIEVKRSYDSVIFAKERPGQLVMETFDVTLGQNTIPELKVVLDVSVRIERPEPPADGRLTAVLDADLVGTLRMRTFRDGDRFVPLGMKESTKLKNFFISQKIPREKRRTIPLLLSNDDIVWIVGERIDDRFKVTAETTRLMKIVAKPLP
jgi:tRNA(Ile)-lysidine synthase